jgi:hypothetical protein
MQIVQQRDRIELVVVRPIPVELIGMPLVRAQAMLETYMALYLLVLRFS